MPEVFELTIEPGPALLVDAGEQLLLDVEPLDDRFDDPVASGDAVAGASSKPPVVTSR